MIKTNTQNTISPQLFLWKKYNFYQGVIGKKALGGYTPKATPNPVTPRVS